MIKNQERYIGMYNHLYIEQLDVRILILCYFFENENIYIHSSI